MADEVEVPPDLLTELRATGSLESTGSFTVDLGRAADLLARYRFHSPYEYVLKLVQAAVAGGARDVVVQVGAWNTTVRFDAAPFRGDDLADLSRWLLGPPREEAGRALGHLAAGLNAARGLDPERIEVSAWYGEEGVRLRVDAEGARVERVEGGPAGRVQTSVHVGPMRRRPRRMRWTGFTHWFDEVPGRSLGDYSAEVRALWEGEYSQVWRRCAFAPVPLVLNGRVVNRPLFGLAKTFTRFSRQGLWVQHPHSALEINPSFVQARQPGPFALPAPALPGEWLFREVFPADEDVEVGPDPPSLARFDRFRISLRQDHLGLAVPCHAMLRPVYGSRFRLVSDGVVIDERRAPQGLRGIDCVVSAASLTTDLSGFRPVEDEAWERLVSFLADVAAGDVA